MVNTSGALLQININSFSFWKYVNLKVELHGTFSIKITYLGPDFGTILFVQFFIFQKIQIDIWKIEEIN